ncbi:MAG TPA: hypothetical protein DCE23_00700 [Firmicutes bacterium]|nr:hypothetical protein [Bacillota bacterium]
MKKFQYGVDYFAYDMDLIEKMFNIRICGVPLSFFLLDLRKTDTYCHLNSDILAYFMEDSNRVEGELPSISGDDKGHSWVEKDDFVFDTITGAKWKKDSYYERYAPYNCVVLPRDSSTERIKEYLQHNENYPEMYVAIIRDMEEELPKMIYGKVLRSHIDRFIAEKKLDSIELDSSLVDKFMIGLKEVYRHTKEFKDSAPKKN